MAKCKRKSNKAKVIPLKDKRKDNLVRILDNSAKVSRPVRKAVLNHKILGTPAQNDLKSIDKINNATIKAVLPRAVVQQNSK